MVSSWKLLLIRALGLVPLPFLSQVIIKGRLASLAFTSRFTVFAQLSRNCRKIKMVFAQARERDKTALVRFREVVTGH